MVEFFQLTLNVIYFLIFTVGFFYFLPVSIYKYMEDSRSKNLDNLAKIFGLKFEILQKKSFFNYLNVFSLRNEKRNMIEGKIKNHHIRIWDEYRIEWGVPAGFGSANYTKKTTHITIDWVDEKIDGLASINFLNQILIDLRDNDIIYKSNNLTLKNKALMRSNLLIYITILILLVIFLIYLINTKSK